ncbi:MAG: LPP20 family lipoprotein [Sulfurimonas sp.]|uniref:LPP20 family lipoprotein n=1 Tax=Sulfurimonas sp. TaxID=2022749 RepID=UPI0028CF196B|nr:LPP20 family lipoprotein [Sulfurimonas sp.]MDT8339822.1 LPP20 family lipoprotein [Sulfurimonas sp.]
MKYSILIAMLLSISTLSGADKVQTVDAAAIEQTNAELSKVRAEIAQAKLDAAQATAQACEAKKESQRVVEELAVAKAEKEEEIATATAKEEVLRKNKSVHISVVGQGVAPMNTSSPAQAYALAKRAAIADAYRAIAEKVKGVRIDGQDTIKNMMVQRSTVRTYVQAMVRNADIVETTFKEGLCEVEMEILISHADFAQ